MARTAVKILKQLTQEVERINPAEVESYYVKKALACKLAPWYKASDEQIQEIYTSMRDYLSRVIPAEGGTMMDVQKCMEAIDAAWPEMQERLRQNPVLTEFMLDYGAYSQFFYPFLLRIPQASTLEVAFCFCHDLLDSFRRIPRHDTMYAFAKDDAMFRFIRSRVANEQKLLKSAQKVFFVGGGLLSALRRYNYPLQELQQEIVVYDMNEHLQDDLDVVFGRPFAETGITFVYKNAETAFYKNGYQHHFDVIDASGVLSYRSCDYDLTRMLHGMKQMLAPGGSIIFDLQVMHSTLLFDRMLGWKTNPPMKPELTVDGAIRRVKKQAKLLDMQTEVVLEHDIGVQFVLS